MKKIIVAITGATGAIYAIRLLEELRSRPAYEVHLVISSWGEKTIEIETDYSVQEVKKLAAKCHENTNLSAAVASGSFKADAMIVVPCSMKTLAAMAAGYADNLIVRAADVMLKEHRKLIVVPRETPLNEIHLENMLRLTRAGAILVPPMPAFYNHPKTIVDIVNHHTSRLLDLLGIENDLSSRWNGDQHA